jgi:glutathione S-transferase
VREYAITVSRLNRRGRGILGGLGWSTESPTLGEKIMSLTFYFAPMSTASITEAVLAELAIPFDLVTLNISIGDTKKPEFLKVNPNGRVPAIVHEGVAIWESSAITMYLGEVFGVDANLYPAAGPKRGEAMKWIAWGNVTLAEPASRLFASLPSEMQGDGNYSGWRLGEKGFARNICLISSRTLTPCFLRVEI